MYEPMLTVTADDMGPRVEVFFPSLPAPVGAPRVTVWRESAGQVLEVRGAIGMRLSGSVAKIDYEVPFDVPSRYWAVVHTVEGEELSVTGSSTITVASEHPKMVRIHSPLDPRTSLLVELEESALSRVKRSFGGAVHQPLGRRAGVLATTGRQGYTDLNLTVVTRSYEQTKALDALFEDNLPVLCLRLPASHRDFHMPPVLFAGILNPEREGWMGVSKAVWRMDGDEVSAPAPELILSLLRRRDIQAFYGTRAQKKAANASRLQVSRRYELAGFAG